MTANAHHFDALQRAAQVVDSMSELLWSLSASRLFRPRGGPGMNETSFTDLLLNFLEGHAVVQQYQFGGAEEAVVGADWEWWIGADDLGWRCARIQAKRTFPKVNRSREVVPDAVPVYRELKHTVGKSGRLQMDVLIDGARDGVDPHTKAAEPDLVGVLDPYYVFYNGWPPSTFSRETIDDATVVQNNEIAIAQSAMRRTDHPRWGEWAVIREHHRATCSTCRWMLCGCSTHRAVTSCSAPTPQFTHELLPFWGAGTMPAEHVRAVYKGSSNTIQVTPYLGRSLPLSTVLFDQWDVLTNGGGPAPDRRISDRLPVYADAVRDLGNGDAGEYARQMIRQFSDVGGLAIGHVAVTDIGRSQERLRQATT